MASSANTSLRARWERPCKLNRILGRHELFDKWEKFERKYLRE